MGLIVTKSLPTSEEIAPARPWYGIAVSLAVPRSHVYSSSVNCAHERLGILRLSCKSAELRCRAATSINTVCIPSVPLVQFTANEGPFVM